MPQTPAPRDGLATELWRVQAELEHLQRQAHTLARELAAAETQLRELGDSTAAGQRALDAVLRGQCVLYVGGRPSTAGALRALVQRHGGDLRRHDGSLQEGQGLLEAGIDWASLVVFPVDCVDRDSAARIQDLSRRRGVPWLALRSAGIGSFAAALARADGPGAPPPAPRCRRA